MPDFRQNPEYRANGNVIRPDCCWLRLGWSWGFSKYVENEDSWDDYMVTGAIYLLTMYYYVPMTPSSREWRNKWKRKRLNIEMLTGRSRNMQGLGLTF